MNSLEKTNEVNVLRKQGLTVQQACKQVGMGLVTYYTHNRKTKKLKRVRRTQLVVADLPTPEAPAFLIYGNAKMLAEFAREYR